MEQKTCIRCGDPIKWGDRYCSRRCSNFTRKLTITTKLKIAKSMRKWNQLHPENAARKSAEMILRHRNNPLKWRKTSRKMTCSYCNSTFVSVRGDKERYPSTCSDACFSGVKSRNARGNKTLFYNGMRFDSNWEIQLATRLDELCIEWIRPKSIAWTDSTGKSHKYFPDFFLPKHEMYLDPKNPIAMIKQREKLQAVVKLIPLVYGDIGMIISYVETLSGSAPKT